MNQTTIVEILKTLFASGASQRRQWLARLRDGLEELPPRATLRDLAQLAGMQAQTVPDDPRSQTDLKWARLAVELHEEVARGAEASLRESAMQGAMRVRALMIGRYGAKPGDDVRDLERIIRWFLDNLPMSYEEAVRRSADWRALPIDEIRELRTIKNRLQVIDRLARQDEPPASEEITRWLSLRSRLP